ncbi:hypothetical protein ACFXTO_014721 [Malus domestica]
MRGILEFLGEAATTGGGGIGDHLLDQIYIGKPTFPKLPHDLEPILADPHVASVFPTHHSPSSPIPHHPPQKIPFSRSCLNNPDRSTHKRRRRCAKVQMRLRWWLPNFACGSYGGRMWATEAS